MAKYNLLEDDDIFDEEDDFSKPEKSEDEKTDNIDITIDDELLETDVDDLKTDDELPTGVDESTSDEYNTEQEVSITEEAAEPEFQEYEPEISSAPEEPQQTEEKEPEKPYLTDDYEDEKQAGINYKPIILGAVILLVLFGAYFLIDKFFLSETDKGADQQTQQPVKTPEQIRQEQEAAKKKQFLSQLAGQTQLDINSINSVVQNVKSAAKISSILLYDKSLLVEVFGDDRAQVAKVNMNLKEKMADKSFQVVASQSRPGPNGGVFGLFKATVDGGASGTKDASVIFNSVTDAQNWINQQSGSAGLKVKNISNRYISDENNFKKFTIEATINGSMDECNNFLNKLSSNGSQIKINKLNLTAADQQNFQSKKYLLKLVLEVFV